MPAGASGTPSTNFGFYKLSTSADAPNGTGLNLIIDSIDTNLYADVMRNALLTTTGDIIYASAANTPARLAAGTAGYLLTANGAGVAPSWQAAPTSGIAATIVDAKGDLIAATAADAVARQAVGANNTMLIADSAQSTGIKWGAGAVILDSGVGTAVSNTTSETAYVTYSVPADTLGTTKGIMCVVSGNFIKNGGAGHTMRIQMKYGATTLIDSAASALNGAVTSANTWPWYQVAILSANASTSAQRATLNHTMWWRSSGADSGQGLFAGGDAVFSGAKYGTSAEDSTAAKTFQLTMTWSNASASNTWTPFHYTIYLV